ncbi:MAG TPA: Rap1a/Tai family immunity protein [Caulobacteraceae bacterium]|jgi:hypothetical protein|nr:Rap1a/Tai family immunity protein [Caulobacteraceae bacterium]
MAWRSAGVLAALALMTAGVSAQAGDLEFFTGEGLYAQCSAKPSTSDYLPRQARCAGYVLGVSDALQAAQGAGAPQRVCLPATASSTQLVEVVSQYLDAHSEKRRLAAQDLVIEALSVSFSCK